MEIIDAQFHLWEAETASRPWDHSFVSARSITASTGGAHVPDEPVTVERALVAMRQVGVDAAIAVSPSLYGYDASYCFDAARRHPGRFGVVGYLDHTQRDLDERMAKWMAQPYALGLRVLIIGDKDRDDIVGGGANAFFAAAERQGVPVCLLAARQLDIIADIARSFPNLQLVLDHLGHPQPPSMRPGEPPFEQLQLLLDLAAFPNIAVKVTAAPTLARTPYPYPDLWRIMHKLMKSYGVGRLMWGSDWTRASKYVSHSDNLRWIAESSELSPTEKEQVMGASLRRIFRWPKA